MCSSSSSSSSNSSSDSPDHILDLYIRECQRFQVPVDAGICAAIKLNSRTLVFERTAQTADILPLHTVLVHMQHLEEIHLRRSKLTASGMQLLVNCLPFLPNLVLLNLEGSKLGPQGALPLLQYLSQPDKVYVRIVNLRLCSLGSSLKSPLIAVVENNSSLKVLDISSNQLGETIITALQAISTDKEIDLESNLYIHEVVNSITHGIGLIVAMLASYVLMKRALQANNWRVFFGTLPYALSLCLTYLSSTLYHSLFKLRAAKRFFKYLDHGSVFFLIAGTYTPFLTISLANHPAISMPMLVIIWGLAFAGLYVTTCLRTHKLFASISTTMYLTMGWMCIIAGVPIVQSKLIPEPALVLLLQGGIAYTIGVLFLIRGGSRPWFHIIWHCWVLAGSAGHYAAILLYVVGQHRNVNLIQ